MTVALSSGRQTPLAKAWTMPAIDFGAVVHMRRLAVLLLAVAVALVPSIPTSAAHATPVVGRPSAAVSESGVALSGSPGVPIVDTQTHTLYVPIQCVQAFCSNGKPSHVLDLINTARCTPKAGHCSVVAKAQVGVSPVAAALDNKTHTLYVVNAGGTDPSTKDKGSVSVLDTRRCNVSVTRGCHRPLATIHTGGFPVAAALDSENHTLYLANLQGSVIVVNVRRCKATTRSGCHRRIHAVTDKAIPSGIAVDDAHSTVYASNIGPAGSGHTVSLINAAACNGQRTKGCRRVPHRVTVGVEPFWVTVDQKTHTVYTANGNEETVSILNARTCNASVRSGCRKTAKTVVVGSSPQFVGVDQRLHTLFALNSNDDTVASLDTRTCRAGTLRRCPAVAKSAIAAANQARHYVSFPSAFALVPKTSTLYTIGIGGQSSLGVLSVSQCNATTSRGCRHLPASIAAPEGELTTDIATHTLYAANAGDQRIDVFGTAGCNSTLRVHCSPVSSIPIPHPGVALSAVNNTAHTLYAADEETGNVLVIDVSSCTATTTTGCGSAVKATVHVGQNASALAENTATHSLYVVYGPFNAAPNATAVLDVSSCKAADTSGCSQTPATVPVGPGANALAVSVATNTVYVSNTGTPSFGFGNTVSVINGATCQGSVHSGCTSPVASARVGTKPWGILADDNHHSIYVVANADGDTPGDVTVINTSTCNGTTTGGCGGSHPAAGIGRSGLLAALDIQSHALYVTDFSSAAVSVLNTATCNSSTTTGCSREVSRRAVASLPYGIAVDAGVHTVYVATFGGGGTLSMLHIG